MIWQDYIFSIGSILFMWALIPMIKTKDKPPVGSSVRTGGVLLVYALVCYTTLHLWYSFVTTLLLALMWLYIGFQKRRENGVQGRNSH